MLVVLASRHDRSAERVLERWGGSAALLSCEDLCTAGWRFDPAEPSDGTAVVAGRTVPVDRIDGVLTLRSSVFEDELVHLEAGDRAYVAAETTAFLLAWLSALACRVVNRPSPLSLLGPRWRREEWVQAAVRLGMPAVPTRRSVGKVEEPEPASGSRPAPVVVVGDRWFGDVAPELGGRALRLARHAGVDLLETWFDDPEERGRVLDATPAATLRALVVVDAVRDLFPPEPSP